MKVQSTGTLHPASHHIIQGCIAAFVADLRAAGYARNTLSTKRVTLERFIRWRGRRKRSSHELTESEISEFLTKSIQIDRSRRSVASKFITIPLALEWSQQSKNVQRSSWARKLSMVRQFARWLSVIEPRHQIPPPRLLNVRHRRNKPHLYTDQEIVRLIARTTNLTTTPKRYRPNDRLLAYLESL